MAPVLDPLRAAGITAPELVQLNSPYRLVITPIVSYVKKLAAERRDRRIVAVVPELVERRWFHWLLHTQRAELLKAQLLMEGHDRISILSIPWYEKST